MDYNSLISAASFSPKHLQPPNAWVGHLPFAAWLIKQVNPKIFVELGTHSGNSYFSFCQAVQEENLLTKCYAVDTWKGDEHSGHYGEEIFQQVNSYNQKQYAQFSSLMRMTFDEATAYFADASIDLLHIDGFHTYEAVKHDFETWLPKLSLGAVVVFHDTNVRENEFGVWKFWEEIQNNYPLNLEFTHSHGLGVIQLNNSPSEKHLSWLSLGEIEQQILKNYFSSLGFRQIEHYELNDLNKAIIERDLVISNLNQIILERDSVVNNLNQLISERDSAISNLNQLIVERDLVIGNYEQIILERDSVIGSLNETISNFNKENLRLNQLELQLNEEISQINQSLSERDLQIANLRSSIAERDDEIIQLSQAIAIRDNQISNLEFEVSSFLNSKSWQITKPFRSVNKLIRRG